MIFRRFFIEKSDKRNFIASVQSEPIEDIEIIPENEVPKGSPPVDLSAEFAELNQESGNVMAEGSLCLVYQQSMTGLPVSLLIISGLSY